MFQRLRESGNDIKVLIMTGNSTHEWAKECANLKIEGYIEKPLDHEELIEKIKKSLDIFDYKVLRKFLEKEYDKRISLITPLIREVLDYINQNVCNDISREDIASHLDISPEHLSRSFREQCGLSLIDYINRCKIEKSCHYIKQNKRLKVGEISAAVGIKDANYFYRIFKKHTGLTPTEYKKKALVN